MDVYMPWAALVAGDERHGTTVRCYSAATIRAIEISSKLVFFVVQRN